MAKVGGEQENEPQAQESSWEEAQTQESKRLCGRKPLDLIMECAEGSLSRPEREALLTRKGRKSTA